MLAHKGEALGVVHQAGKVDQVGCGYDTSSSREQATYPRFCSCTRGPQPRFPVMASPPRNPIRASAVCGAPHTAQFERDLIGERTRAGLTAAAARGRKGGRKPIVTDDKLKRARGMVGKGLTVREIATRLKVGKTALYEALRTELA